MYKFNMMKLTFFATMYKFNMMKLESLWLKNSEILSQLSLSGLMA